MKGEDDIRTNAMDRLVKVGPSAVSTDLVPGRSERPTEPDRDNSVGHSPGGIHTKGHPGTLIIVPPHRGLPTIPHKRSRWREETERGEEMASVRSTQESQRTAAAQD